MKGIAINFIFMIIISIILLSFVISLYFYFLSSSEKYYCYNLYKVQSSEIPEDCKKYIPTINTVFLNYSTIDDLEKAISIYISRCWVRSERGLKKEKINCFTLEIVSDIQGFLNFTRIRNYVKEYSDLDPNIIYVFPDNLDIVSLSNKKTILIIYNGTNIIVW